MKNFTRSERVSCHIKKVLSDLLQKNIKDPRLETVTITSVKVSQDLRNAKIYFVTTGSKNNSKDADEGFKSAYGYLKRELAGQLNLRYMPDIKFFYDESFDYASNIENLLKSIKKR